MPRSIAAVPWSTRTDRRVLQVLDKHTSPTFSCCVTWSCLAIFPARPAAAIRAARVQRDSTRLLQAVLTRLGDSESTGTGGALVAAVSDEFDTDESSRVWRLVDRVVTLRRLSDREQLLVPTS